MFDIKVTDARTWKDEELYPIRVDLVDQAIMAINKDLEKKYMAMDVIKEVEWEISDNKIYIHSPGSSFINRERYIRLKQADLLEKYKNVLKLAKQNGTKLRYKKSYKKYITENWKEYEQASRQLNDIFDELLKRVKHLEKRGIHYGCSDDEYLSICSAIGNSMDRYYWRTSIISKMQEINHELDGYIWELRQYQMDWIAV